MAGKRSASERQLAIVRRAYARQMLASVGVSDNPALEDAFATIPREGFVGPPPWQMSKGGGYSALTSSDPVVLYQDVLIALAPERGVNNGSPSLHAHWLNALAPRMGERVVHIGAGTGYYSAILARLVGAEGHVVAVEYDPRLAEQAKANLAAFPNVTVMQGDGADWPREPADCIYVNFSLVRPAQRWFDQLELGGRLIFPLGVPGPVRAKGRGRHSFRGAGYLISRKTAGFAVSWLGAAFFVCAEGRLGGTQEEQAALLAAFDAGGAELVRSLRLDSETTERVWLRGDGWSLAYDEIGA